jgi:transcriptional regulator with XRE-family HTH domain
MKAWTANQIRRLRESAGMTQAQLAEWLGVIPRHVDHLEKEFRAAGTQTVRLLNILAERVESGEWQAVRPPTQPKPKKRRKSK